MLDFQKIRRKQKWLFGAIAIVVSFSFVILFTPDAEDRIFGRGGQAESGSYGQLNGEPVTRSQWFEAQSIILAPIRISYGGQLPPLNRDFIDAQIPNILREQALMKRYGISPSRDDLADSISRLVDRRIESYSAQTRPTRQEEFSLLASLLTPRNGSAKRGVARLEALVRHQLGAAQLRSLSGVSAMLLSAKEAEIRYRENNEEYEAEGIFLAHTNYLPLVQATEEQLKTHYTNNLPEYRIFERRQLSYVTFPATNYLDAAEKKFDALNADERGGFLTNYWAGITSIAGYKTNSIANLAKQVVSVRTNEYAGMEIDEATTAIRTELLTKAWNLKAGLATLEAYKAGSDFQKSLVATHKAQPALDTLEKMALLQNLTARTTVPMSDSSNPVPGLSGVPASQMFGLSLTNAFIVGDPFIDGSADFYIASLKQIIPSRNRTFAEVKTQVTAAYKKAEGIKFMKAAGEKIHQSIKAGKSLAEVAKENNLTVTKLGPFSSVGGAIPGLANKANSEDFRTQALGLEVGAASELITSSTDASDPIAEEAAFVVKLTAKTPVAKEKFDAEFADYLENERASAIAQAYTPWLDRQTEDAYKYSLDTDVEEGEGSIELQTIDGDNGYYKQNTRVKIVAKPAAGHEFKEWTRGVTVNTGVAENEIVVSRNTYISASFAPKAVQ